jgi:hypothetical protein
MRKSVSFRYVGRHATLSEKTNPAGDIAPHVNRPSMNEHDLVIPVDDANPFDPDTGLERRRAAPRLQILDRVSESPSLGMLPSESFTTR